MFSGRWGQEDLYALSPTRSFFISYPQHHSFNLCKWIFYKGTQAFQPDFQDGRGTQLGWHLSYLPKPKPVHLYQRIRAGQDL